VLPVCARNFGYNGGVSKYKMEMQSAGATRRDDDRRKQTVPVENDNRSGERRDVPENKPADRRTIPRP
jgi:hypothetical protein